MEDTARDIQQPLDQYVSDLEDAVSYQPPSRTQIQPPSSTTASNEDEVTPVQESEIIDVNVDVVPSQQSDPTETPKQ
jgi:hypothetical protein